MLRSIFYARFHPERGPAIIHQFPPVASKSANQQSLFEWTEVSPYIIPPYELCGRSLSVCNSGNRILGFPISLEDEQYERNRFTFNVCFVLDERDDILSWEQVVRKTTSFFRRLEEEDGLLQKEETFKDLKWANQEGYPTRDVGIVYHLLENIMQNMNRYGETCSRINDLHILNLRLASPTPAPPKVRAWDVPLLVREVPGHDVCTWDLALQRVHSHIDGINHIQKIAEVADVELKLVKNVIRELLYHRRVQLLDIFHFQAIYECTPDIVLFVGNEEVQDECRKYVMARLQRTKPRTNAQEQQNSSPVVLPTRECVVELYCSLQLKISVFDFCAAHQTLLANIDIRRFITFGLIRGFLRRIHRYALTIKPTQPPSSPVLQRQTEMVKSKPKSNEDILKEFDRAWKKAVTSSGWATPPSGPPVESLGKSQRSAEDVKTEEDEKLRSYLDGNHCMDQISTEMHMSESRIVERLKSGRFREVVFFSR